MFFAPKRMNINRSFHLSIYMNQYTFKDIEDFLHDDDFFQWAKNGAPNSDFDIDSYKSRHPGCEN